MRQANPKDYSRVTRRIAVVKALEPLADANHGICTTRQRKLLTRTAFLQPKIRLSELPSCSRSNTYRTRVEWKIAFRSFSVLESFWSVLLSVIAPEFRVAMHQIEVPDHVCALDNVNIGQLQQKALADSTCLWNEDWCISLWTSAFWQNDIFIRSQRAK